MQLTLPEQGLPAWLRLSPDLCMDDEEYWEFCMSNPGLRLERTAEGEIVIVPPARAESDAQSADVIVQLGTWAKRDGRGRFFGMSVQFILPTRLAFSPDAAWVSHERLAKLSSDQPRGGVDLGWLIHPNKKTVHIDRAGEKPEQRAGITRLADEGPVAGFELDLTSIWAGL